MFTRPPATRQLHIWPYVPGWSAAIQLSVDCRLVCIPGVYARAGWLSTPRIVVAASGDPQDALRAGGSGPGLSWTHRAARTIYYDPGVVLRRGPADSRQGLLVARKRLCPISYLSRCEGAGQMAARTCSATGLTRRASPGARSNQSILPIDLADGYVRSALRLSATVSLTLIAIAPRRVIGLG